MFTEEDVFSLQRTVRGQFPRIKTGNYYLSIQASEGHYCYPRETLSSLGHYVEVEIAIIKDGGLIDPRTIGNFEWADKFEEGKSPVAGYVYVETVVQILNDLEVL